MSEWPSPPNAGKEWQILEKAVMASVDEQRRARRWGIFFKLLTFAYLTVLLVALVTVPWAASAALRLAAARASAASLRHRKVGARAEHQQGGCGQDQVLHHAPLRERVRARRTVLTSSPPKCWMRRLAEPAFSGIEKRTRS